MARGVKRSLVGIGLAGLSYALVRSGRAVELDETVDEVVRVDLGEDVDAMVSAATDVASVYGLAGTAAALALTGRRSAAVDVAGAGILAWSAAQAVKPLLDRQRPYENGEVERLVHTPAGTSWPSGHTAVAAAMGAAAADHGGLLAEAAGFGLTTGVAASRIYVGVHHATDTLAGAGMGLLSSGLWRALRSWFSRG